MKKVFITLVLTTIFSSSYSIDFKKLRLGVIASPSTSWLGANAATISDQDAELGFSFGFDADYFFADNYALNTGLEMNYMNAALKYQSGKILDGDFNTNNTTISYAINYLKIPIGFKFLSDNIGAYNIYVNMGLQFQFLIGAEGTTSGGKMYQQSSQADPKIEVAHFNNRKISDEVNSVNLSYKVEAGTEYYFVGKTAARIGLRYEHGLTSTIVSDGKEDNDSPIRAMSLILGLVF